MKSLDYLMGHILYQIFKISLNKHGEKKSDNPSKRITFKIGTRYCLKLLTPETMKLIGSTKSNITKDETGENVPYLKIIEAGLIHSKIVNNNYHQNCL